MNEKILSQNRLTASDWFLIWSIPAFALVVAGVHPYIVAAGLALIIGALLVATIRPIHWRLPALNLIQIVVFVNSDRKVIYA